MTTTAIQPKDRAAQVRDLLEANKAELAKVMPRHVTPDRLLKVAVYCISKTPKLQECTPASLIACIKQCAELGLEPGGALGLAYLVPFNDKKSGTVICTLIIGYRGFIELARRSGQLSQIEAHVVHENDTFEVEFGLDPKLSHTPKLSGSAGRPLLVYAIARLKDGGKHVEVMTWEAVQAIRRRSRSADTGPWVTDEEEMARKTVLRRAAKYLPLSPELADALTVDSEDFDTEAGEVRALPSASAVVADAVESRAKSKAKRTLAAMIADPPAETPQAEAVEVAETPPEAANGATNESF